MYKFPNKEKAFLLLSIQDYCFPLIDWKAIVLIDFVRTLIWVKECPWNYVQGLIIVSYKQSNTHTHTHTHYCSHR